MLALHFAGLFSKIPISTARLLISAFIGALYAVIGILFFENEILVIFVSFFLLLVMILIATGKIKLYRKVKYTIAFLAFQILIGGVVYYGYTMLSRVLSEKTLQDIGKENGRLLTLSLLVLLSVGVLKLMISFFGNVASEKSVRIAVKYKDTEKKFEAFVDSGNLAVDPFDKTPVMLMAKSFAKEIFGIEIEEIYSANQEKYEIKKRLRVIPASFGGEKRILYVQKRKAVVPDRLSHRAS